MLITTEEKSRRKPGLCLQSESTSEEVLFLYIRISQMVFEIKKRNIS